MASGCPVISANCSSGVREIIGEHNEYGLLAEKMTGIRHAADEPLDSGEMSLFTLMRKVIGDKELREGYVRHRKERVEFFSVEWRLKEYEEFIREGCRGEVIIAPHTSPPRRYYRLNLIPCRQITA